MFKDFQCSGAGIQWALISKNCKAGVVKFDRESFTVECVQATTADVIGKPDLFRQGQTHSCGTR